MRDPESIPAKPERGYTKRLTLFNNALAWTAIGGAMALGREMAGIVVPLMVILIASLLGIYQGIGHFDLRALSLLTSGKTTLPRQRNGAMKKDAA